MPLESMLLKNFQRHTKLRVQFSPGLTTIVGPNSAGKSTVFRAIKAASLNRWRPSHLRHGKDYLSVSVTVDGETLKAFRGKGKNSLRLGSKVYKATRKEVPPTVAKLLNVGEENFQGQGDVHFWFGLPPSQVSARLNEIVDLTSIDRAVSKSKALSANASRRLDFTRERLHKAKKEERELRWASGAARQLARADRAAGEASRAKGRADRLSGLVLDAGKAVREGRILHQIAQEARSTLQTGEDALEVRRRSTKLSGALKKIASLEQDLKIVVPDIGELERVRAEGDRTAERRRNLEYLIQDYVSARKKVKEEAAALEAAVTRRCPTCGQRLPRSKHVC